MLKIRLKQQGRKNAKTYRVVVAKSTSRRDGKTVDELGIYNPIPNPSIIELDMNKFEYWLNNGAQMTGRVRKLYEIVKSGNLKK